VSLKEAIARAAEWRRAGKTMVYTNGCFDMLHLGHVRTLESARQFGDVLVVGVNGDESARSLKGAGRPVFGERERAELVAALHCVDLVVIFRETGSLRVLQALRPKVWVKGGDYALETVNQDERTFVESYGGRVALGQHVPGVSTTDIIERIKGIPDDEC
jgi:D-beta-D-heptose 7-phosphate kinase/D-beta-D-heptose 1-phosphate adenosyltransferase